MLIVGHIQVTTKSQLKETSEDYPKTCTLIQLLQNFMDLTNRYGHFNIFLRSFGSYKDNKSSVNCFKNSYSVDLIVM